MTSAPPAVPVDVWQRLSPRMLLVHPVHEVLRQLPLLIGSFVLGSATGNPVWSLGALGLLVAFGLARWFTTSYRIDSENVALRTGVLHRKVLSVPRNRIRAVETDARLLHRLLGLTVLRVSTGQEAKREGEFVLDAVEAEQVPRLRSVLLAGAAAPTADDAPYDPEPAGQLLARWQPSWLRYSPVSVTGLAMILAAVGLGYQSGIVVALQNSRAAQSGLDTAERFGVAASVAVAAVVVVLASVVLAVLRSLLTYGNLELRRSRIGGADVLHLRHGLLRVREHTFDMRRLRGGTLREALLVRTLGGARLDAVMTGVNGAGEASLLLPPCPADTAQTVLAELISNNDAVRGPLRAHGPSAARRRWTRALVLPVVLLVAVVAVALTAGVPGWLWPVWVMLTVCCALLAADRVRSLGHRVDGRWLVARAGSLERRRDCIAAAGIIGWTVRQTLFQRRVGVATLVAATAAGTKRYQVIDVPAELAWSIAGTASPWVADSEWAHR
ncbi:MAG: putative rane protein [Mycobacterium sp.]|nr:putative rane protein [Mycobacterium sp.]